MTEKPPQDMQHISDIELVEMASEQGYQSAPGNS
jgi:hypothetical protein